MSGTAASGRWCPVAPGADSAPGSFSAHDPKANTPYHGLGQNEPRGHAGGKATSPQSMVLRTFVVGYV